MKPLLHKNKEIFENLFVMEIANNHLGNVNRGIKIIRDHGTVARFNNVRAAFKLQFRDVDQFIHPEFKGNKDIRYIKKTESTKLRLEEYQKLLDEIHSVSGIPMATPFDEVSVDLCEKFNLPIIKIASSDVNDWVLIDRIAATRKPVIVSTGGTSEKDLDDLVTYFERRNILLAINHCVSLYPSEDGELDLDQIDYLKNRYPNHVIGLSTHEYHDWYSSMLISYGKGARTWERHIDIEYDGVPVSPYCSLPHQIDRWFKAFHKAAEMCGGRTNAKRNITKKEVEYLDGLVRGVYAKKDLEPGYVITKENFTKDFYLAIPLRKGQISCRELINGERLIESVKANQPLTINNIDGPYNENESLRELILNRGL